MPNIYVVSDLHLMDRQEEFLFNSAKEDKFVRLCETIEQDAGQLVMAGDIFDFTGMTPCRNGQREFFSETVPNSKLDQSLIERVSKLRSTEDFLLSTKAAFPRFFESLRRLAEKKRLVYIPGNHDCDFLNFDSRLVFSKILGVSDDLIEWTRRYEYRHSLIVLHGNEFDPPNVTDRGCQNPGFIFTSALYHAVLPALRMLGVQQEVLNAIPAVRPEENVVIGLEHYLDDETLNKILIGLARLLQRNGYFRGLSSIPGWFLTKDIPLFSKLIQRYVTAQRIAGMLPNDEKLMKNAREGASKLRTKAFVISGHTHELDKSDKYINLGTWNDHLSGIHPNEITAPNISLPVLFFDEHSQTNRVLDISSIGIEKSFLECPSVF